MSTHLPTDNNAADELGSLRRQIDKIDDSITNLLIERTQVVEKVGHLKHNTAPGICPIRPGREATMIRRIIARFENTPFLPAAAAAIWRTIIGMSTSVESTLRISAFAPDTGRDLYWIAREYFGPFAPIIRQPQVRRVIGDVIDGKAAVGIVPVPRGSDAERWWTSLLGQNGDMPKIFARVPFVETETFSRDMPCGLAIARLTPEASGDDMSLLVLDADGNTSQHKLQTAFVSAKLDALWIDIFAPSADSRLHLIEIRGFIPPDHPAMHALLESLGNSVRKVEFLGAYAVPVTIASTENNTGRHATGA